MSLLDVKGLSLSFQFQRESIPVVSDVSFSIQKGETLGLVGESGCGKSLTALSLTRLLPSPPAFIDAGEVWFEGHNLFSLPEEDLRTIRGSGISMIFQEPMTALNPIFSVGEQMDEVVRVHEGVSRREARMRSVEIMQKVGIPGAAERYRYYPHQLSGGMRQRCMIAMALICTPSVLIADEPTTALDATIQAQILDLLRSLQKENQMGLLLITHDLGVVAQMADRVAVMYAGQMVEIADVQTLFRSPKHPYTMALKDSLPQPVAEQMRQRLPVIEGRVPAPHQIPVHCRFFDRCVLASEACREPHPALREVEPGHFVRCVQVQ